jgi:hypothetical protein
MILYVMRVALLETLATVSQTPTRGVSAHPLFFPHRFPHAGGASMGEGQ